MRGVILGFPLPLGEPQSVGGADPQPRPSRLTEGTERMSEQQQEQPVEQPEPQPDTPDVPSPEEEEEGEQGEESDAVEGYERAPEDTASPDAAAGAVGEKELEKMFGKVERANVAYAKKLGEIMQDEIQVLEQCPRCSSPFLGFIFPPMMQPVSAEVKDKVLASVGEQPAMASQPANFARRCDDCDGNGVVLSGSRRNEHKAIRCVSCEGRGFVYVGDPPQTGPTYTVTTEANTVTNGVKEQAPDEDLWGRKVGHPDYGRHPMYVGQ